MFNNERDYMIGCFCRLIVFFSRTLYKAGDGVCIFIVFSKLFKKLYQKMRLIIRDDYDEVSEFIGKLYVR